MRGMEQVFNEWLNARSSVRGLLACGIRHPDETVFIPASSAGFPAENVETSLRCIADTFQVLRLNHLSGDYVRWIYENALLYSMKHHEGVLLGLFTSREADAV